MFQFILRLATSVTIAIAVSGCQAQRGVAIAAAATEVPVTADASVFMYELFDRDRAGRSPRAVVFYVQGSGDASVTRLTSMAASGVILDFAVVLTERRGITPDGSSDPAAQRAASVFTERINDHKAVIDARLGRGDLSPDTPIILIGGSEGGAVAAAIASKDPRITHLMLLASGGWTQARELEFMLQRDEMLLGINSLDALQTKFDAVRDPTRSKEEWAGHTFARWGSFLWYDPMPDVHARDIPLFIAHGTEDESVPIESAREILSSCAETQPDRHVDFVELDGLNHAFHDIDAGHSGFPSLEIAMLQFMRSAGIVSDQEFEVFADRVKRNHPEVFGVNR